MRWTLHDLAHAIHDSCPGKIWAAVLAVDAHDFHGHAKTTAQALPGQESWVAASTIDQDVRVAITQEAGVK
jgi:hypothetical protein